MVNTHFSHIGNIYKIWPHIDHKAVLNKFQKFVSYGPYISKHSIITLEINNEKDNLK